jgi:putative Mg2+ transporter-C (MgtC) family protein
MDELDLALRLVVALLLTAAIGYNRERNSQPAGLRTHMLVGLGAALFTILSMAAFNTGVIAAQVVSGIGFLGAGAILRGKHGTVHGLTTAADIWASAAVGMAAGAGKLILATTSALLILITLTVVGWVEKSYLERKRSAAISHPDGEGNPPA